MFVLGGIVRVVVLVAVVTVVGAQLPSSALASPEGFCAELSGVWNGAETKCEMSFTRPGTVLDRNSGQHTVRITAQYPADLIDNPAASPVLRKYLCDFSADFGNSENWLLNPAGSDITYKLYEHSATVRTVVFHNAWHVQGTAHPNDELRTFAFDLAAGRQFGLTDIFQPGLDPLVVLPPLVRPYLQATLNHINAINGAPAIRPEEFEPKTADHPNSHFDGYEAFALTKDELVLMLPAQRIGPMGAGLMAPRVPLTALKSVLRPEFLPR